MQELELARRLAGVEFFSGLSEATRRQVAGRAVQLTHRPGTEITHQGAEGAGFHLITDGSAIVKVGGETRATLAEGDSFGEISLIDGEPRSATVIAGDDGLTTVAISPLAFEPLLDDPEVARALLRVVTSRLRAAEARAAQA
jgi:CRP/FNR family transcriptional regulator, cyclic AMP receptor protein